MHFHNIEVSSIMGANFIHIVAILSLISFFLSRRSNIINITAMMSVGIYLKISVHNGSDTSSEILPIYKSSVKVN